LWAGPLCAHLLGAAGAQVVKVESSHRLDGARRGDRRFFDLLNAGHESVVLDLTHAADRCVLGELCDRADVVVSASRPRAWVSLDIDPYEVCRRSETTWVAITGYGLSAGDRVAFGDDCAMAAGVVAYDSCGEPERNHEVPLPCGDALADPLTGMHAAVAAMASYRAGGSRVLDISMRDVVAATVRDNDVVRSNAVSQSEAGDWVVETETGLHRVRPPMARVVESSAPPAGFHTAHWRAR
jgi:crotonobetainyl-CoA:carnitine CoA-transferase CaiB-like acyl-CoA transferase